LVGTGSYSIEVQHDCKNIPNSPFNVTIAPSTGDAVTLRAEFLQVRLSISVVVMTSQLLVEITLCLEHAVGQ